MRDWLIAIRHQKGMSQKQIADSTGISQGFYSYIENGHRGAKLPVQTAKKIAAVLEFEWERFYDEKENAE